MATTLDHSPPTGRSLPERRGYPAPAAGSRGLYTSLDVAGLIAATIMALGPLTAYAVGL